MTEPGPDPQSRRPRRGRALRWFLRGMTVLVLALAGLLLLLAFPPNGRSVGLPEFARARIEAGLDASMPGGDVTVDRVGLSIARGTLMPRIRFVNLRLSEAGRPRVEFPALEVEIDRAALLEGEMRPRQVSLAGAGLRIRRTADGRLDLAFTGAQDGDARDLAQTLGGVDRMFRQTVFSSLQRVVGEGLTLVIEDGETGDELRIDNAALSLVPEGEALILTLGGDVAGTPDSSLALRFTRHPEAGETDVSAAFQNLQSTDVAAVSAALEWLTLVDAPLSGRMSTTLFDDATLGTLSGELDLGAGRITPGGGVDPLPLDALTLRFDYDAATSRMYIEEFRVESPILSGSISGHATLLEGPVYLSQFQVSEFVADPPGVFEAPVSFAGGALDMRLQLYPHVAIDFGQAVLYDEGLHVTARGRVAAEPEGLSVRIDADIPEVATDRVLPLWPVNAIANTRRWLAENVIGGTVRDAHAAIRLAPGESRPRHGITFDFEESEVRAIRNMAPIEAGRGYMDISGTTVSLALHGGYVTAPNGGRLQLAESVMLLTDTRQRPTPAHFELSINGPISSAMTLIGAEPFNLLNRFPFDPGTVAEGQADLLLTLDMELRPRIPPEEVRFGITGRLLDVRSEELVPGRVLRSQQLHIEADNHSLSIGGPAMLDGLSANATWSRELGPDAPQQSRVTGEAILEPQGLADFGVVLPDGMLSGRGPASFVLDLVEDQPPRLAITSDLSGVTLAIPSLGWRLPASDTGSLELDIILGDAPDVPSLVLRGDGLFLEGAVELADRQFDRLRVDRLLLDDWLDVSGSLVSRGPGLSPRIQITGGEADLRGLPVGGGGGSAGALPLNIRLDRLEVTDGIFLTDLRAELSGSPIRGEFRGLMGGQVPVNGTILGEADGVAIRLRSDDGGAVLRAAGIYRNAYGGRMDLILRPLPGEGRYSGSLTIDNPRLRNAPAIAELLSAISVVGLIEQLATGEGVALGDVEVIFSLTPDVMTITEGTALGASMGLSLDGIYNTRSGYFDFEGVVSPLYVVNGLVGGLFTPRREGLFGFTYRLTGTADNSDVTVNPLSVLTPGIFREIFRRLPPEPAE